MHYTGNPAVIDAFFDTDPKRRLAIVACSGANRNVVTAGGCAAIRRRQLHIVPTEYWGVSSGIPTLAYLAGAGKLTDARVFSHDTNDKRLFDWRRKFVGKQMLDIDYLDRVFRGIETDRGIDAEMVMRNRASFNAIVSDPHTGSPFHFIAQTADEVYQLASMGCAITGTSRPVFFRDREISDGGFTTALFPIQVIMEQQNPPTDILVFASRNHDSNPSTFRLKEEILPMLGLVKLSKSVRSLVRSRCVRFWNEACNSINRKDVRVLVIWHSEKLPNFNIPTQQARRLILQGYQYMEDLFNERGY